MLLCIECLYIALTRLQKISNSPDSTLKQKHSRQCHFPSSFRTANRLMTYTSLSLYLPIAARTSVLLYIRVLSMILNPHRHKVFCFVFLNETEGSIFCATLC